MPFPLAFAPFFLPSFLPFFFFQQCANVSKTDSTGGEKRRRGGKGSTTLKKRYFVTGRENIILKLQWTSAMSKRLFECIACLGNKSRPVSPFKSSYFNTLPLHFSLLFFFIACMIFPSFHDKEKCQTVSFRPGGSSSLKQMRL